MTATTAETTTHTLEVPGAVLTYDIRRNDARTEPVLLLIGSPMGAAGFGTLSATSPTAPSSPTTRGGASGARTDPATPVTLEVHADDLHRLIAASGAGRSTCSPAAAAR